MYQVFTKMNKRLLRQGSSRWKCLNESVLYHTDKGVYGFIPKSKPTPAVASPDVWKNRYTNCNFYQLVNDYRRHGHKISTINPVKFRNDDTKVPELNPERYGLAPSERCDFKDILFTNHDSGSVQDAVAILKQIYCGPISYEYLHLENQNEVDWLSRHIESNFNKSLDKDTRFEVAKDLLRSQAWDNFLAIKFPTVKRYGGEGAESMIAFFRRLITLSAQDDIQHIVLAMPHRGKLNLLTGLLECPPVKIFNKFKGKSEFPSSAKAMADIASHFSASVDLKVGDKEIHFIMLNNPSHLEAVNPVSMGKARSKQMNLKEGDYSDRSDSFRGDRVLNVQLHGDGAFVGQGINQECLMLSQAPNFDVGGSVHMVVNNQVGFTTPAHRARSCRYTTDLAKTIGAPVIHVNADYPELVYKAVELAFAYQRHFRKDVFIDLNCFRRWGHNELDDPTFTNPLQYKVIQSRKSIPDLYAEQLKTEGILTDEKIQSILREHTAWLQSELDRVDAYQPEEDYFKDQWLKMTQAPNAIEIWDTGVDVDTLRQIGQKSVDVPSEFITHSHLHKTYVTNRLKRIKDGAAIDWATAEALAFGSLLLEGHNVRLSGEDVGRGTFSQRHAMLVDQATDHIHVPLNHITPNQPAFLEVANSILSEEAVLGYEYGMAIDSPDNLIVWEAQFGDFFNGAQIIIDTFIASGETKWMTSNGLVLLLPHGYDGAASEHSSCRLERFLQLTDSKESSPDGEDVNMQVVFPTTPAQYFHLLRRQIVRNYRKPLVVVSPKMILRLSDATSALSDMAPGTHFNNVIGDTIADPARVKRVILVSGKHYYALNEERIKSNVEDVAILRLECLTPFPVSQLQEEMAKYKRATKFIWSQEEHKNMGAWTFVKPRFENMLGRKLQYSGRAEAATPAVGVGIRHRDEVRHIVHEPLHQLK